MLSVEKPRSPKKTPGEQVFEASASYGTQEGSGIGGGFSNFQKCSQAPSARDDEVVGRFRAGSSFPLLEVSSTLKPRGSDRFRGLQWKLVLWAIFMKSGT
jgi:hypothetical protein